MPDDKKTDVKDQPVANKDGKTIHINTGSPRFRDPDVPPGDAPRLLIPRPLWDDMQARCRLLDCECSGVGAIVVEKGDLVLRKLYRVPQTCSGGDTNIDKDSPRTHAVLRDCFTEFGIDPRFWWHSHNSMSAFWSGTDQATKHSLFRDWGVALVLNHRGEWKAALVVSKPVPVEVELPVFTFGQPEEIDYERLKKELSEDVVESWYGAYASRGCFDGMGQTYDMQDYFRKEDEQNAGARGIEAADYCDAGLSPAERAGFVNCCGCDGSGIDRNGGHRWCLCPDGSENGVPEDGGLGPGHR